MTDEIQHTETEDLFRPDEPGCEWVVLHTRPRAEKKIIQLSGRQNARFYLPVQKREHRYGGRLRVFEKPLFTGYVFCKCAPRDFQWFRQNHQVARVIAVENQDKLCRQLAQLHQALTAGKVTEVLPYLEKGRQVHISYGPMKGLEGVVIRRKGEDRFVLQVEMIQQSILVEVDHSYLEPI